MKLAIIFAVVILFSAVFASRELFEDFKKQYNKQYSNKAEELYRMTIFLRNMKEVERLNNTPGNKATYGVTKFMDLTQEEFKETYLNYKSKKVDDVKYYESDVPYGSESYPSYFNWVNLNATTPVYDQGQCGSCWAFSATETIESFWYLAGNSLTQLSMQQVVSCDHTSLGCNGGDTTSAYRYVIKAGGIETYAAYPYTSGAGKTGTCQFNKADILATISGWSYVTRRPACNETLMQQVTYTTGPLSVCVDAVTWQFYRGGIITSNCGQNLDHCVQVTGFATSTGSDPIQYWIVRNSWGATWGEQGFIWIEMFKNLCGIADEVTIVSI